MSQLLPPVVVTAEATLEGPPPPLLPEEALQIVRAAGRRRLEYAVGRHCARVALAQHGVRGFPLLNAPDRAPRWPDGFVGSITHTGAGRQGWCAAAVTRAAHVLGLGVDAELETPLEPELWDLVLCPEERAALRAFGPSRSGVLGKLAVCAKESFYKLQFPMTRCFLAFTDARVEIQPEPRTFSVTLLRNAGPFAAGGIWRGRYLFSDGLIVSAMTRPASC